MLLLLLFFNLNHVFTRGSFRSVKVVPLLRNSQLS